MQNLRKTRYLQSKLAQIEGFEPLHSAPCFNEFALRVPMDAARFLDAMEAHIILAGVALTRLDPQADPRTIVVTVTEKRSMAEIDAYADAARSLRKAVAQ